MPIFADQIVFTNVEAEQSPSRRRGYQTLFYSRPGLSVEEVRAVELRLFYVPKGGQPTKHVFFPLASGKTALAQIVPLPGTDQFGRSGRYLAHALVFTPDSFSEMGNNPFAAFQGFKFWTTVEDVLVAGDFKTGAVPPADVRPDTDGEGAATWAAPGAPQLRTLLLLAAQAARLSQEHRAVGLLGSTDDAFYLLQRLFALIPPPLRPQCSFDTLFVEGSLTRQPYWAVGLPTGQPRQPKLLPFDLKQSRFLQEIACDPANPFEEWLASLVEQQSLEEAITAVGAGAWRQAWANGQGSHHAKEGAMEGTMFQAFMNPKNAAPDGQALKALRQQVGPALGERILPQAVRWLEQQGDAAPDLGRGFPAPQLTRWIGRTLSDPTQRPLPEEVRDLERFVMGSQQSNLKLVYYRWAGRWADLAGAVRQLDDELFRDFADWALETVPVSLAWRLYRTPSGVVFGPEIVGEGQALGETAGLLGALLGVTDAAALPAAGDGPELGTTPAPLGRSAPRQAPLPPPASPTRWLALMEVLKARADGRAARE